jgi:hypothetical protein
MGRRDGLISPEFQKSPLPRSWETIQTQTKSLWEIGKKGVKSHFDDKTKELGIRDSINRRFVEVMQQKDNVDAQTKVNLLAQSASHRLFNPFLKLKGGPNHSLFLYCLPEGHAKSLISPI